MDITIIGTLVAIIGVFVAVIIGLCTYLWRLSDKINTLTERIVRLETIWDVRLAGMGKNIISQNESISNNIQEEK